MSEQKLSEKNYSLDEIEGRLQNTLFAGGDLRKDNSYLHPRDIKLLVSELEKALGVISMLEHHWISPMEYYEATEKLRKRIKTMEEDGHSMDCNVRKDSISLPECSCGWTQRLEDMVTSGEDQENA